MKVNNKSDILKKVKLARISADLSQNQIAEQIGITSNYYSQIESGSCKNPSEDTIIKIANILSLHPHYLLWEFGRLPSDIIEKLMEFPALFDIVNTQYVVLKNNKNNSQEV